MNTCEKYIVKMGGKITKNLCNPDGYFLITKYGKRVFIDSSVYESRKRMSKKFKRMVDRFSNIK